MKILYVTVTLPYSGGAEVFFVPEIEELLRAGHNLRILPRTKGHGFIEEEARSFFPIVKGLPLLSFRVLIEATAEFFRTPVPVLRVFATIISRGKVTERIKNLIVFPKGVYAGRFARQWGADHIHAQWASTTATLAWVAHEISGVPWSFTAHRGDIVQRNLLSEKISCASFVRLISNSGIKMMEELAPGADGSKYRLIHMGVSIPSDEVSHPSPRTDLPFVILTPANLIPLKGHQYLITAISILKERGFPCRLDLAGEGPQLALLKAQAVGLGLSEEVIFLGQRPHWDILARYVHREVDAVVLPSMDFGGGNHEGIPVSLIEAMAYGVPVVATTTGGIPELVTSGAGILVPPGNAQALAEALEALIQDDALRWKMAEIGRRRVLMSFDVVDVVRRLAVEMSASIGPLEARSDLVQSKEIS